jgi:hypothetical protein
VNSHNWALCRYAYGSLVCRTAISDNKIDGLTDHAMLVALGQSAQSLGLIWTAEDAPLHQESVIDRPQTKTLEFFATSPFWLKKS